MDYLKQQLETFGPWSEEALPIQCLPRAPQYSKEKKASVPRCESVDLSRALATEGCELVEAEHFPSTEFLQRVQLPVRQLVQKQAKTLFKLSPTREVKPALRAVLCAPVLVPIRSSAGMIHSLPIRKPVKAGVVRKLQDILPPQIREVKKVQLRKRTKPQVAIFHKGFPPYRRTVEYNLFRNVRKYAFNRSLSGLI